MSSTELMIRPMLAAPTTLEKVQFPCYVSPKLDGIRGLLYNGRTLSRSLKDIPNKHVSAQYSREEHHGLDGEFIVGNPTAPDSYRVTNSALMTHGEAPDPTFYVFDDVSIPDQTFRYRLDSAQNKVAKLGAGFQMLEHHLVKTATELFDYEEMWLGVGFEGLMIRHPMGKYKYGRSTEKQGWLLKLKRFSDSEAVIIGVVEMMSNQNEAKINALGLTERSSHKENQIPMGTMGALKVRDIHHGWEFEIGTGFTAEERQWFWDNRQTFEEVETLVKYQYFPIGMKDLPRHPSFKGLRSSDDM